MTVKKKKKEYGGTLVGGKEDPEWEVKEPDNISSGSSDRLHSLFVAVRLFSPVEHIHCLSFSVVSLRREMDTHMRPAHGSSREERQSFGRPSSLCFVQPS